MNTPDDHLPDPLESLEHPGSSLFIPVQPLHPTEGLSGSWPSSVQGAARAPILNPYEAFANETYRNPRSSYCLSMGLWEKAKESCGYRRRFVRWIRRSDTEMLELAKEDWGKILREQEEFLKHAKSKLPKSFFGEKRYMISTNESLTEALKESVAKYDTSDEKSRSAAFGELERSFKPVSCIFNKNCRELDALATTAKTADFQRWRAGWKPIMPR